MSKMGIIQLEEDSIIILKRDFFVSQPEEDNIFKLEDNSVNISTQEENSYKSWEKELEEIAESFGII